MKYSIRARILPSFDSKEISSERQREIPRNTEEVPCCLLIFLSLCSKPPMCLIHAGSFECSCCERLRAIQPSPLMVVENFMSLRSKLPTQFMSPKNSELTNIEMQPHTIPDMPKCAESPTVRRCRTWQRALLLLRWLHISVNRHGPAGLKSLAKRINLSCWKKFCRQRLCD